MRTRFVLAALTFAFAAPLLAQEAPTPEANVSRTEDQAAPDEERAPQRHIKVLENPYEISSFYRSSQGGSLTMPGAPSGPSGPYAIAGYYRSGRASTGYASFWTTGYGPMNRGRAGRGFLAPRRRPIGLNGELCLFAPTFLAPVGPLTGSFWGN